MSDLKHLDGAVEYLDGAKAEMIDRASTYDSPGGEKSMGKAVAALNIIAGEDIARTGMRECHGWLLMSILKRVRQFSREKPHRDSAVDAVAYAALEAEARMNEGAVQSVDPKYLYSDAKEPEKPSCVTCRFTTRAGGCFGCRPDFKNYKWDGFSEGKTA